MDLIGLREETLLTEGTTTVADLVSSIPRDSRRDLLIRFCLRLRDSSWSNELSRKWWAIYQLQENKRLCRRDLPYPLWEALLRKDWWNIILALWKSALRLEDRRFPRIPLLAKAYTAKAYTTSLDPQGFRGSLKPPIDPVGVNPSQDRPGKSLMERTWQETDDFDGKLFKV